MSLPLVTANGASIPAIGLGTSQLLGDTCVDCVKTALWSGYRFIDTAARYDNEEAVGAGIRASDGNDATVGENGTAGLGRMLRHVLVPSDR